jgi:ketosteroid isomerase-like protein
MNPTIHEEPELIVAMERAALDRWAKGDPSGFLKIYAPDIVYFDPTVEQRQDGIEAVTSLYEKIRGKIHLDRYELISPTVQLCGEAAVLTFNYAGYAGGEVYRWNCTEVYRRGPDGWRIIQSHWSLTRKENHV